MSRVASLRPPEWVSPAPCATEFNVRVVTPMFGGGAIPKVVDSFNPIRAAAIRGHLRFWWRAVRGGQCTTAKELFEREQTLWGSMSVQGEIAITVAIDNAGRLEPCAFYERGERGVRAAPTYRSGWPPYALFPFKGETKAGTVQEQPAEAIVGVSFTLTVTAKSDDALAEAEMAVNAWILFGGVGSRTRRGCGSLQLQGSAPQLRGLTRCNEKVDFPILFGSEVCKTDAVKDPVVAWNTAVKIYNEFRQAQGFARNEGRERNRPGRSRWPEPDAIRRITDRYAPEHAPTNSVPKGFPRADLGLPIIFHFQGGGDPADTTLQGMPKFSRMASPVITKAVQCNGGFAPTLIVLNAPHVWEGTEVTIDGQPLARVNIELTPEERAKVAPMKGKSVREALLARAEEMKWTRSTLS